MFAQSNTRLCVAQQLGKVEASGKRASNPAIREALLEFAKALREIAGLLTKPLRPSDAEVDQLAKRRTARRRAPAKIRLLRGATLAASNLLSGDERANN